MDDEEDDEGRGHLLVDTYTGNSPYMASEAMRLMVGLSWQYNHDELFPHSPRTVRLRSTDYYQRMMQRARCTSSLPSDWA